MRNAAPIGVKGRDDVLFGIEAAIFATIHHLSAPDLSRKNLSPKPLIEGLVVFSRLQEAWILSDRFFRRVASHRGERGIDPDDRAFTVGDHKSVHRRLQSQGLKEQLPLGFLALGDVLRSSLVVDHRTAFVPHGARMFRNPDRPAVFAVGAELEVAHLRMSLHEPTELDPICRINVELSSQVGRCPHHLFR